MPQSSGLRERLSKLLDHIHNKPCADEHRQLGVKICRVKSVLDTFSLREVWTLEQSGNQFVNGALEVGVCNDDKKEEGFIRRKYKGRKYFSKEKLYQSTAVRAKANKYAAMMSEPAKPKEPGSRAERLLKKGASKRSLHSETPTNSVSEVEQVEANKQALFALIGKARSSPSLNTASPVTTKKRVASSNTLSMLCREETKVQESKNALYAILGLPVVPQAPQAKTNSAGRLSKDDSSMPKPNQNGSNQQQEAQGPKGRAKQKSMRMSPTTSALKGVKSMPKASSSPNLISTGGVQVGPIGHSSLSNIDALLSIGLDTSSESDSEEDSDTDASSDSEKEEVATKMRTMVIPSGRPAPFNGRMSKRNLTASSQSAVARKSSKSSHGSDRGTDSTADAHSGDSRKRRARRKETRSKSRTKDSSRHSRAEIDSKDRHSRSSTRTNFESFCKRSSSESRLGDDRKRLSEAKRSSSCRSLNKLVDRESASPRRSSSSRHLRDDDMMTFSKSSSKRDIADRRRRRSKSLPTSNDDIKGERTMPREEARAPPREPTMEERLSAVLAHPDNKTCSECFNDDPTWASFFVSPVDGRRLGVFCCYVCYSLHKQIGGDDFELKNVRETEKWTQLDIGAVEMSGNSICNLILEAGQVNEKEERYKSETGREAYHFEKYCNFAFFCHKDLYDKVMLDADENRVRKQNAVSAENDNSSLKPLERKLSRESLTSSSSRTGASSRSERASSSSGALFDVDIVLAGASSDPRLQKRVNSRRSPSRSKRGDRNRSKSGSKLAAKNDDQSVRKAASRRDQMRGARKYASERGLMRKDSFGIQSKRRGRSSSSRDL